MTYPEVKFKRVLDRNDGGTWGFDPTGSGDTVVLRSTEQTADGRWAINEPELRSVSPQEAERYLLRKGDLLITKSSGSALHIGKTTIVDGAVADLRAVYSNFMQRVRLSGNESPEYFWYVLRTSWIREQWVLNSTSTTGLANLNADTIDQLLVPHPPLDEQRLIAEYLDRETGKIDELITKQEQLVATLTERVTALWGNQIDLLKAHCATVSIRRVVSSVVDGPFGSSLTSAHYSDAGARVIRLGNIGIFTFKDADEAYIPLEYANELSAHAVLAGDVVVAGLGDDKMPLGRAAVVPDTLGIALVKADCYRVRPNKKVTAEYLAWVLSSPQLREQFKVLSRGSTRQRLNTSVVREAIIPLPPRDEQYLVVEQFARASEQIGHVVSKATKVVGTLRERRAALISAAVTGKIDVRGL